MTDKTNQKHTSFLRKADIILLSVLLLLSTAIIICLRLTPHASGIVTVTVDGSCIGHWALTEEQQIWIDGASGTNCLYIANGTAVMTDADCPDLICVHHTPISHVGERIVCLPNRVIVSIDAVSGDTVLDAVSQ